MNKNKGKKMGALLKLPRRRALLEPARKKRLCSDEALRENEERLRNLVKTIKDWIWEVDPRGIYSFVSPGVRDLLGYEPEDLLGKTPFDIMPPDEAERMGKIFGDILKTAKPLPPIENTCLHKDGHPVTLETSGVPFFAADGTLLGYRGVDRDITGRKEAEEALRKSEKEYRSVIENIQDVFYRSDRNGRLIMGSPSGVKFFGYDSLEEMIGLPLKSFWADPKDRETLVAEMKKFGRVKDYEAVLKRKDGTTFDRTFTTHFYYDGLGNILGTEGIIRDITERKRAENALKEKTAELDRFFSLALDLLAIANTDGYFQRLNRAWEIVLGYEIKDLEGRKFLDFIHPDDLPATLEKVAELSRGNEVINFINRYRCRDGSYRWIEWRSVPYQNKLIYAAARDITQRKQVDDALRETEERYRALFDGSPDCVYIHDFDGNFIAANSAALKLFGYDRDELLSLNFSALAKPDQLSKAFKTFSRLRRTGTQKELAEFTLMRKDGGYVDVEAMGSLISHEGKPYAIQGIAPDITKRKKAEETLRKSEEEAKRLVKENKTMAEIGRIISSSVNIDEVYERFAEEAKKIIQFDKITVSIFNLEEMTYFILFTAGVEVPGFHKGDCRPIRSELLEKAGRMRPGIIFQVSAGKEAQGEEEIARKLPSFLPIYQAGLRSFLRIPLISKDEAIGSLNFTSREFDAYSENDLQLARKIANQIAGAIANALIFTELKRVEEELRMAQMELEARVQDRTADLVKINKELQNEIVERKHTEELLKNAKEAAEASSTAKSTFLANMSHELRTPLNAIIGFTELMADEQAGALNETQKEYTGDVLRSSRHLLSLINDILDLSKVEAGKLQLDVGTVFLPALLQNSFTMIKEKSLKHGIQLRMEIGGIPEKIRGDERKLKQVLYNLLSNAVKFTPDGGIVTLGACRFFFRDQQWTREDGNGESLPFTPSSSGEWVGISVRDTGSGLEKEDLDRIFDPFEQADNSASRRYQGTGLGLTLTRRLVEIHGGNIWAESEGPGKGSRFRFLIPLNP